MKTKTDEELAIELIDLSLQHMGGGPYALALLHVFNMARSQGLPWAKDEVLTLATDAMDRAVIDWCHGPDLPAGVSTGAELLNAAEADGVDLLARAKKLLRATSS